MSWDNQVRTDLMIDVCGQLEKVFEKAITWEWRIHRAKPGDVIEGQTVTTGDLELALTMTTTLRKEVVRMLIDLGYTRSTLQRLGEQAIAKLEATAS